MARIVEAVIWVIWKKPNLSSPPPFSRAPATSLSYVCFLRKGDTGYICTLVPVFDEDADREDVAIMVASEDVAIASEDHGDDAVIVAGEARRDVVVTVIGEDRGDDAFIVAGKDHRDDDAPVSQLV